MRPLFEQDSTENSMLGIFNLRTDSIALEEYLHRKGILNAEQLEVARKRHLKDGGEMSNILIKLGFVDEKTLNRHLKRIHQDAAGRAILLFYFLQIPVFLFLSYLFRNWTTGFAFIALIVGAGVPLYLYGRGSAVSSVLLALLSILLTAGAIYTGRGMIQFHFFILVVPGILILLRSPALFVVTGVAGLGYYVAAWALQGIVRIAFAQSVSFDVVLVHMVAILLQSILYGGVAIYFYREWEEKQRLAFSIHVTQEELEKERLKLGVKDISQIMYLYSIAEGVNHASFRISQGAQETSQKLKEQVRQVQEIKRAIREMTAFFATMGLEMADTKAIAEKSVNVANTGKKDVERTIEVLHGIVDTIQQNANMLEGLDETSRKIIDAVKVIEKIASKTNLLSLNAAIEAARAGEEGKGFAVVADEVSKLADMTQKATRDISSVIQSIEEESRSAVVRARSEAVRAQEGIDVAISSGESLETIVSETNQLGARVLEVSEMSGELNRFSSHINRNMDIMSEFITQNNEYVHSISDSIQEFSVETENLYTILQIFNLSDAIQEQNKFMLKNVEELASRVVPLMEKAIRDRVLSEEDLFDRDYKEISGTNPKKYKTKYDDFTDRVILPVQEEVSLRSDQIQFAIIMDDHGYVPSHNLRWSKPYPDDPKKDEQYNRTKRIFTDRTALNAAMNTKPFLLQTYRRYSGEFINDISVPILLHGRHWGAVRIGFYYDNRILFTEA